MIKFFIYKLFIKYFLQKHKFLPSTLIYRDGTRTLFEVDSNYYDIDLNPITIVRAYPIGKQLMGISRHEMLEFREFKSMHTEGMAMTTHGN